MDASCADPLLACVPKPRTNKSQSPWWSCRRLVRTCVPHPCAHAHRTHAHTRSSSALARPRPLPAPRSWCPDSRARFPTRQPRPRAPQRTTLCPWRAAQRLNGCAPRWRAPMPCSPRPASVQPKPFHFHSASRSVHATTLNSRIALIAG